MPSPAKGSPPPSDRHALALLRKETSTAGTAIHNHLATHPDKQRDLQKILKQPYGQPAAHTAAILITPALSVAPNRLKATHQWVLKDRAKAATDPTNPTSTPLLRTVVPLLSLMEGKRADRTVRRLTAAAHTIVPPNRLHDLLSRILQQTITTRKAHSGFYTKPSAATLIAHLAVPQEDPRWASKDQTTAYRVADYSCGTGRLLVEAYRRIQHLHAAKGGDPAAIHDKTIRCSITGCDILPAATAAAAHALTLAKPRSSSPARDPNIITLHYDPLPSQSPRRPVGLGSLDILDPDSLLDQDFTRHALSATEPEPHSFDPESQDLVLLNPPFARHSSHADADLNLPDETSGILPTTPEDLRRIADRYNAVASAHGAHYGNGPGHPFAAPAMRAVKPGGTIALILPSTVLASMGRDTQATPKGWSLFRKQLLADYRAITVVSLAAYQATGSSFCEDTGTADVIIIATKRTPHDPPDGTVCFVNLSTLPQEHAAAEDLAALIKTHSASRSDTPGQPVQLRLHSKHLEIMLHSRPKPGAPWHTSRILDPDPLTNLQPLRQGITAPNGRTTTPSIPLRNYLKTGRG